MTSKIQVREATYENWPELWQILEPVYRAGETYPYPTDITESEAKATWMGSDKQTFVAVADGADDAPSILGTYYLKPNQPGQGRHVCNCGYMVAHAAQGQGVARTMCHHSLTAAKAAGYTAMQYNLVVSTNVGALHVWKSCGFEIIGTLPKAFNHPSKGLVDAHVMYQIL